MGNPLIARDNSAERSGDMKPREARAEVGREVPTGLESRAGIRSLDELQATRRSLFQRFAPLAARFKGGATAGTDASRKRHRALVAKRILVEIEQRGEKAPSEAALERMGNADTEHIQFCDSLELDYTRFILLESDIQEVSEQIRSREIELYSYNAELRLSS